MIGCGFKWYSVNSTRTSWKLHVPSVASVGGVMVVELGWQKHLLEGILATPRARVLQLGGQVGHGGRIEA